MRKTYLLLTLLLLCVGISIHAQVTTASMSGKVTDTSSEAMIGVNIKATHTPTGTEYYTITQPNGSYSFNNLRIGRIWHSIFNCQLGTAVEQYVLLVLMQ